MSRRNPSASSFWVGYADLMTSLFFVFLVVATTLALGFRYQASIYEADARELARIREIASAASSLTESERFFFNEEQSRFELKNNFMFGEGGSTRIDEAAKPELIAAGRDIERVLRSVQSDTTDVRFKVVIEGRAARHWAYEDRHRNADRGGVNREMSYKRALALATLWSEAGIDLESYGSELFVAGAGFEGKGRYPYSDGVTEGKNKQIVVQVIPFLSPEG